MGEQVHGSQHILFHALCAEVVDGNGRIFHHIVQEAGLLLGLGLAHQAHGQHMGYGRIAHHILHPVMGIDGDANDIFNRSHTSSECSLWRQRYALLVPGCSTFPVKHRPHLRHRPKGPRMWRSPKSPQMRHPKRQPYGRRLVTASGFVRPGGDGIPSLRAGIPAPAGGQFASIGWTPCG